MSFEKIVRKIWILPLLMVMSCDLEIEPTDSIILDGISGIADVSSSVADLYNSLNGQIGDQANLFALNEVTTDELLVPTRGTDWGDNGIWRQLHDHTWSSEHNHILTVWSQFNQNVFRATQILDERSVETSEGELPVLKAEAQFIRAFSMWIILDLFGVAPFREVDEGPNILPRVMSRTEAMEFVLSDIRAALPNLPVRGPGAANNRVNRAAANLLLAKVLINAHIYDGSGTPSPANMQAVIEAVNSIESDGFSLEAGFFELFEASVDNETIWFLETNTGNRMWNGLHYNQAPEIAGGGWNGFSTLAEFYDLFEGDPNTNVVGSGQEERRGFVPTIGLPLAEVNGGTDRETDGVSDGFADGSEVGFGFLIGQQFDATGTPLNDRPGDPLIFTRDYPSLSGSNERNGIRMIKYNPRFVTNGNGVNHEIVFRFSDAHLLRAEARMRIGQDPTADVNALRSIRNASELTTVTEQDLIDERGRELYMEHWRRNDLIRFGRYTRNWEFKNEAAINNPDRELFPIPRSSLINNPNLQQNPGY